MLGLAAWLAGCSRSPSATPVPPRPDVSRLPAGFARALADAEAKLGDSADGRRARLRLGQLYQANQYDAEARVCYLPLADDTACGAKASYYLGTLALAGDDLADGIRWLEAALRRDPSYVPARLRLADACYKAGCPADAAEAYAAVLREDQRNPYALLATAREKLRLGDNPGALAVLQRLTAADPDFGAGAALYAQLLDGAGDQAQAAAWRDRARAHKDPPAPDPWMDEVMTQCYDIQRLAMIFEDYAKANRVDESLRWLERLEAVDPQHWLVRQIRGLALADRGRLAEAAAEYEAAIAGGGDAGKLYAALVSTLTGLKRYADADAKAIAGLAAAPQSPALLVSVALLRQAEGDVAEAERRLQQARAIEPRNTSACRTLALIWWGRGEQARALPLFEIVMGTDPHDLATRGLVGEYLLQQDRPADAREPLEQAWTLDPKNENIADLLALACLRLGNQEARAGRSPAALAAYDRAIAVRPTRPEALTNKARLCVQLGQFAPAEQALRQLSLVQPENAAVWLALGDVQHAAGHDDDARANWSRVGELARGDAGQNLREAAAQRLRTLTTPR